MRENKLLNELNKKKVLISDGATGTNLQQRGLPRGIPAESWVLENPQAIITLHKDFIAAGADIILTCTFGGTALRLAQSNLKEQATEINQKAVGLAKQAAEGSHVLIAGSVGPLGVMLKPLGTLDIQDAKAYYIEQARVLDQSGIDFFLVETQFDIHEAIAALEAIQEVSDLPVVCSFSYDRGTRTMMGVKPAQTAQELSMFNLTALGINCGKSLEDNLNALKELSSATQIPIWFKPNAGMPKMDEFGNPAYDVTPEIMGGQVASWLEAGARIVGGCCGTSPAHLKAIASNR